MFRALNKSKIAFVMAILFLISLFFFKSGSRYSNFFNSDSVIAKVSGTSISTTKFNRTMQMNINKFNQMLGKEMSGDQIRGFQIHNLALGALINDALFEDEFNKIKFNVHENIIALETKKRLPQLYDSNNKLNELYLNTFLQEQQLQIEDIVQIINFETRNKFFSERFFNINFPIYFSNQIKNYENHEREISYIEIRSEDVKINQLNSSELKEELNRYYNENKEKYLNQEKRDIEYLLIDKQMLGFDFKPSDFEVKEYYNSNKELFLQNEKRSFIQFNFKTIENAKIFKEKIQNLKIQEIIDLSNEDNLIFSEFKNLQKSDVLDQISESVFNLLPNEKSEIIETSLAKHLIILKSIIPSNQQTLDEVKENIISTIQKIEIDNQYNILSDQISDKILNGEKINNIASSLNLKLEKIKDLTRDFNKYDESKDIFYKNLIKSSFVSNTDFVSNLVQIDDDISYIFNVSKINTAKPLIFEEVEKKVLDDWEAVKKIDKMNSDTLKNIDNLTYLSSMAKKYNVAINQVIITNKSNKIPSNISKIIFGSEKGTNIQGLSNNKFFIAKINEIIIPINDNLENISMNDELRDSFAQELMGNKNISTNENLLSALLDQY